MSTTFEYQGFDVIANWSGALGSAMAAGAFTAMSAAGSNAVGITTKLFVASGSSSTIVTAANKSTSDATLVAGIRAARANGQKVLLAPQIQGLDGVPSHYLKPTDTAAFFASFKAEIVHLAVLAQQTGVDTLSIGNELGQLTGSAYRAQWLDIIAAVRQVYSGKLTYKAATNEAKDVSFWDKVDTIGFNAYLSLSAGKDPTVADLVKALSSPAADSYMASRLNGQSVVDFMQSLATTYGKPLLVTEVGFRSIDGGATDPGQWYRAGTADQTDQANAFTALMQVLQSRGGSWLSGMMVWGGANIDTGASNPATDYSVFGKAAGSVIQQYFTGAGSVTGLTVAGSSANDLVDIGSGDDTIATGLGNDVIRAGAGNDTIVAGGATVAPNATTTVTLTGYGNGGRIALMVNGQQVGATATFTPAADASGYQTYTFTFANPDQVNSLDVALLNSGAGGTAMIRGFTINGARVAATDVTNKFQSGTLNLVEGSIHLDATGHRDWFYGVQSDDDTIQGGAGDDTIDGGAGLDTAVYSGDQADYSFARSGDSLIVTDGVAGRDGRDTLTNVEFLKFKDGTVAVASLQVPDAAGAPVVQAAARRFAAAAVQPVTGLMKPTILGTALRAGGSGASLAVAGVSAAGATVTLSNGGASLAQATADASGAYSLTLTGLAEGVYRLSAKAALGGLASGASDTSVAVVGSSRTILGLIASAPGTPQAVLVTDPANAVVGTVDQLSRASWALATAAAPPTLAVSDAAANVSAALGFLGNLPNLSGITLTDSHALPIASVRDMNALIAGSAATLAKIAGGYTFVLTQPGSNGAVASTSYDAAGTQLSSTVTTATPSGKSSYTTFADGSIGQQSFGSAGQLLTDLARHADGSRDQYDFGITGQAYTSDHLVWDRSGRIVQVTRYDAAGRLYTDQTTAASGAVTLDSYASGVLATRLITQTSGASELRTYDRNGVVTTDLFRNADGSRDQYDYGITGQPYASGHMVWDRSGKIVQVTKYDAAGRLYTDQTTAASGAVTLDSYASGVLATRTITQTSGASEVKTYDRNGVVTTDLFRHADGSRDQYDYGITGQAYASDHLVWDRSGKIVQVTRYDAAGRLYTDQTTAASGAVTLDSYASGVLATRLITQTSGASELRTYDRNGVVTTDLFRNADGSRDQYDYGITGQPYTSDHLVWDRSGKIVQVTKFDAAGRLYTDQTTAASGAVTLDSYASGVLATRTITQTSGASEVKTYDRTGRMTTDLFRNADGSRDQYDYGITGQAYTSDHLVWDRSGKIVQVTRYDAAGRLYTDQTTAASGTVTLDSYTSGVLATRTLTQTNGATETRTFDRTGLMTTDYFRNADGSRDQYDYGITGQPYTSDHLTWNAAGQVVEVLRYRAGGGLYSDVKTAADGSVTTLLYDEAGRKTQQAVAAPNGARDTINYDASGATVNRSVTDASGAKHYTTYGITGQAYTSQTVDMDAAGNRQAILQFNTDGSQSTQLYASGITMGFNHAVDKIISFGGDTFQFASTPFRSSIQNFQGGSGAGHDTIVLSRSLVADFDHLSIATAGQTTTVTIDSQHSLAFTRPVGPLVAADFRFV